MRVILVLVALSFYAPIFGQINLIHGNVIGDNQFEETGRDFLTHHCNWFASEDGKELYCSFFKEDSNEFDDILSWDITALTIQDKDPCYEVIAGDGHTYLISFMEDENVVLMLNVQTNGYSSMSGEGVNFSDL